MATRLLEKYKWTKDGRKWVFYTYIPTLDGKRKKYQSPAFSKHTTCGIKSDIYIKKVHNLYHIF